VALARAPLALVGILLALAGCGREDGAASPAAAGAQRDAAVPVTLAPVRHENVDRTVSVIGSIYGDEQVLISAEVPGRISRIVADVGDRVAEGAVLARIDPTDYQLMVDQ
jgi:multidrug efflux pump subunit AcrA (membrane-fusion protein)